MKTGQKSVKVFKIANRRGFAVLCSNHLTEGITREQALARMAKALRRTSRKRK